MKNYMLVLFLSVSTIGVASTADGYKKLAGSYAISSKNIVDPAPGEKKDRLVIFIEGDAARDTYIKMSAPAKKNACDPGLRTKAAGGLVCSVDVNRKDYQCTFGVILKTGVVVDASVC